VSSSPTDRVFEPGHAVSSPPGESAPEAPAARPGTGARGEPYVEVMMPQMGVSVAEGTLAAWHKHVGDEVAAEETLCEIVTDKVDTEIPAPASGTLAEILVEVDETVAVGVVLARIATRGADGGAAREGARVAPERVPRQEEPLGRSRERAPAERRRYSPVVRRIASREGVDLDAVRGSGRDDRVRKQDVLAYVAQLRVATVEAGESRQASEPGDVRPLHTESPYREAQPPASAGEHADGGQAAVLESALDEGHTERLSIVRRSIARHMLSSLQTAAHCTSVVEVDMSRVQAAREALGATYLPFVAACAIRALRAHPDLNATLEGESLTRHRAVNLGIAVSLDREGLIVPVIRDAQELSHEGLARRISELARRARAGELRPEEVHGGTFTITNPGCYGTLISTPIINQPQVAILDLEAVVKRAVVVGDDAGRDAIAIRPVAFLCLSWDHRALDGAIAAQFLGTLRRALESWEAA
jgi:pyruvate/2-oxoglutarate dehydrogenase complex dihydrolipoamide acyltransferase (E2) component